MLGDVIAASRPLPAHWGGTRSEQEAGNTQRPIPRAPASRSGGGDLSSGNLTASRGEIFRVAHRVPTTMPDKHTHNTLPPPWQAPPSLKWSPGQEGLPDLHRDLLIRRGRGRHEGLGGEGPALLFRLGPPRCRRGRPHPAPHVCTGPPLCGRMTGHTGARRATSHRAQGPG